jgi:hypothetical protein
MARGLDTSQDDRSVDRTGWQRRFQSVTLEQYNAGERVDMRGPPDMKEYIGGGKLGRGPRPIKDVTGPKYRAEPHENWQKPMRDWRTNESRWTGTPPQGGGEQRVRRGPRRGTRPE